MRPEKTPSPDEQLQEQTDESARNREIPDEEIKKILEEHDKWLKSLKFVHKQGARANFRGRNLKGKNFEHLNLRRGN